MHPRVFKSRKRNGIAARGTSRIVKTAMVPAVLLAATALFADLEPSPSSPLKIEHFDKDPGWDALNNHVVPLKVPTVKQDFGYSSTNFAGAAAGEIGGAIQRSTTPASFAVPLEPAMTLQDKFSAAGSFAIADCQGGAGVFFGFFNSKQPGGSGRPIGSLGLDFDFERPGGRLAVRLITGTNKSCGTFITPFLPGKFRPTPLKKDGTRYHWTLEYDSQAANGRGQFKFALRSAGHTTDDYGLLPPDFQAEADARFPRTNSFTVDLPPGYQEEGAVFDRFGVCNMMKAGGVASMYFYVFNFAGRRADLRADPGSGWLGTGNRIIFEDREITGAHDFGFNAVSHHAGGAAPGEIGGSFWRSGDYAYYADRVGPLNLEQRLEARGKVKMLVAGPDSDMLIGWFSSASRDRSPDEVGNFVGIHVGGPTRIGHYFHPYLTTAKGIHAKVDEGPILTPGKVFDWSFSYDPNGNSGNGELRVTLGEKSVDLPLKPGMKQQGATLDRFGMFTSQIGGQMVKIYLDDITYTTERRP
jgi:hypothetical protein